MKYLNEKHIAVFIAIILSALFLSAMFRLYNPLPEWFMTYYFKIIIAILLLFFLVAIKYFYSKKCLTIFLTVFVSFFVLVVIATIIQDDLRMRKQNCFYQFNQISENPDPKDIISVSLANLSASEEKEIQEIIRKAFEGQYLYRYHYKNEDEMDKLIENLYLPEKYQQFKKKLKKEYECVGRENSLKDISYSLEKIRFSKIRKYKDINNRIGIIAQPKSCGIYYFLLKKIDNQWKIEEEILPDIRYCSFNEDSIIKQLLEQKNNEISYGNKYKNNEYGYELQYSKDTTEIVLDEVFERGTKGNPSFRIKTGGHFAVGVWDNPKNLTARQWIDEQYTVYSGGWFGEFKEITVGEEKAYSASITEPCYIEWVIIPGSNHLYTFGVELCDENIDASLSTFKNVVDSFRFL